MNVHLLLAVVLTGLLLCSSLTLAGEAENLTKASDVTYQPAAAAINTLQQVAQPHEIVLFHGAWCADCQREVPRFMRILELADNPQLQLVEYEVNPQKQDVMGKFQEYGIESVPTFIVMSNGKELGRITEKPEQSLEEDLAAIVFVEN
jgi:thiol-disulfide isomerase/thioredoxin